MLKDSMKMPLLHSIYTRSQNQDFKTKSVNLFSKIIIERTAT